MLHLAYPLNGTGVRVSRYYKISIVPSNDWVDVIAEAVTAPVVNLGDGANILLVPTLAKVMEAVTQLRPEEAEVKAMVGQFKTLVGKGGRGGSRKMSPVD